MSVSPGTSGLQNLRASGDPIHSQHRLDDRADSFTISKRKGKHRKSVVAAMPAKPLTEPWPGRDGKQWGGCGAGVEVSALFIPKLQ